MCGRYGLNHPHPMLADWYRASSMPKFKPRYNIAPTTDIIAVRETESGRIGSTMRWCRIISGGGVRLINSSSDGSAIREGRGQLKTSHMFQILGLRL